MKAFVCVLVLLVAIPASAASVYYKDFGSWHLRGYQDSGNGSCVMSTRWSDGKEVNLNIFPEGGGSYFTLTVYNPNWDDSLWSRSSFKATMRFESGKYGDANFVGRAQIKGPRRLIFRGMSGDFLTRFLHSDSVILFTNSPDSLAIDLSGTAALGNAIDECTDAAGLPTISHGQNY